MRYGSTLKNIKKNFSCRTMSVTLTDYFWDHFITRSVGLTLAADMKYTKGVGCPKYYLDVISGLFISFLLLLTFTDSY